jgi:hypothetical protein
VGTPGPPGADADEVTTRLWRRFLSTSPVPKLDRTELQGTWCRGEAVRIGQHVVKEPTALKGIQRHSLYIANRRRAADVLVRDLPPRSLTRKRSEVQIL